MRQVTRTGETSTWRVAQAMSLTAFSRRGGSTNRCRWNSRHGTRLRHFPLFFSSMLRVWRPSTWKQVAGTPVIYGRGDRQWWPMLPFNITLRIQESILLSRPSVVGGSSLGTRSATTRLNLARAVPRPVSRGCWSCQLLDWPRSAGQVGGREGSPQGNAMRSAAARTLQAHQNSGRYRWRPRLPAFGCLPVPPPRRRRHHRTAARARPTSRRVSHDSRYRGNCRLSIPYFRPSRPRKFVPGQPF